MIKELVDHAANLLLLVRETFPTYTLHDSKHAQNVLNLMGELLASQCTKLRGLEAAMLILAAYYHDIGMVYTADELNKIPESEQFKSYLDGNPTAFLATRKDSGKVPPDVLLDFCRVRHAEHLYVHLNKINDQVRWENIPLIKPLAELCRSHGQPVSYLRSDTFETDFVGACDLRFCAVILRLADILDLDSSRSPQAIYQHMRLAEHTSQAISISDAEWRKHLHSNGFVFPEERQPNYLIKFISAPDEPSVEHDIRSFLDLIDRELGGGRTILGSCSRRWMDVFLPAGVDRRGIISDGYKYGDFKFTLERSEILELFMGEHLYQNPYVFIRELVQNSIDAVRLRMALHRASNFDPTVKLSSWKDAEGYVWVRIDDSGVGMDEIIVREYFLRVGRSYYRSAEVEADLFRAGGRPGESFAAISRFGVGILSCFTVADKVEVSTRRIVRDGSLAKPLTLTVSNVEDFFVLREENDTPAFIHSATGGEQRYRSEPGTSIALRIDPTRIDVTPEMIGELCQTFVMCPPVPVTFNGQRTERLSQGLLMAPLISEPIIVNRSNEDFKKQNPTLSQSETDDFQDPILLPYDGPVQLVVLPFDISSYAASSLLQGQLIGLAAELPDADTESNIEAGAPESNLLRYWPEDSKSQLSEEILDCLEKIVVGLSVNVSTDDESISASPEPKVYVNIEQVLNQEVAHLVLPMIQRQLKNSVNQHEDQPEQQTTSLERITTALENALRGYSRPTLRTRFEVDLNSITSIKFYRRSFKFGSYWCHNGIAIPGFRSDSVSENMPLGVIDLGLRYRTDIMVMGILSFSDDLRPDISIARDHIIGVPFNVHSALQLSLRKAVGSYEGSAFWTFAERFEFLDLISCPPSTKPNLGMLVADPLISSRGWLGERVVAYDYRTRAKGVDETYVDETYEEEYLTPAEIRAEADQSSTDIVLTYYSRGMWSWPRPLNRYDYYPGFYSWLAITLTQVFLDVAIRFESRRDMGLNRIERLVIRSGRMTQLAGGLNFFPPLFFVPYDGDDLTLFDSASSSLNANHKLSKWLIWNAEFLNNEAPAFLSRLDGIRNSQVDSEDGADAVNRLIEDLRLKFHDKEFPDDVNVSWDRQNNRLRSAR